MRVAEPNVLRWTRDQYYKMARAGIFSGRRVELIKGEIIEMSPQDALHAAAIMVVDYALRRAFREGFAVRVQLPLSLGLDSDPEPDVAVVRGGPRDFARSHPTGAVLVVEAAESSLEYDRAHKASLYAQAGIEDYWIVNLLDRQVEVLRSPVPDSKQPFGFGYGDIKVFSADDSIAPLALPDASIPAADLLP